MTGDNVCKSLISKMLRQSVLEPICVQRKRWAGVLSNAQVPQDDMCFAREFWKPLIAFHGMHRVSMATADAISPRCNGWIVIDRSSLFSMPSMASMAVRLIVPRMIPAIVHARLLDAADTGLC